jgi:hypothetical protein
MTTDVEREERDAALSKEYRVYGPPGTGKTTYLADTIRRIALHRQTSEILVASFTRTAAHEIASRGLPLNRQHVGTLHSLAYRAIGSPPVAQEALPEWNRRHPELQFSISTFATTVEESTPTEYAGETEADKLMAEMDSLRARRIPTHLWPVRVQALRRKWDEFKDAEGCVDFTDMIETALTETTAAPGSPKLGYFDEVQDFTALELALVRHWGAQMDQIVLAGDDDQTIYAFKGAVPDAFLDPPIPDERKKVLDQSYRVPVSVHAAANKWIARVSRREPKIYLPRDVQGKVRVAEHRYNEPSSLARDVQRSLDTGQTVMILTTCSYMLDRVKVRLRQEGVPFHNPYRSRADWNPLKGRGRAGKGPADRLLAYLILDERIFGTMSREWTGADVKSWSTCLRKTGVFRRGAAGLIAGLPERTLTYAEIESLFDNPTDLARAVEPSLEWFTSNLLAGQRGPMEYPIRIAQKRGATTLLDEPRLVVGTIHSVKGGQADCSPHDEPVLTTNRGWVTIGDLNPEVDRLVSFNSDHHKIHRGGPRRPDGYAFIKAQRPYAGPLLTITTEASRTRVTPNHHLTVRWSPRIVGAHAVYLMRRGIDWRVGVTGLSQQSGSSGPLMRARREGADAVWILELHQRREDALVAEQRIAWTSGVPDLTWTADSRTGLGQESLNRVWEGLDVDVAGKALLDRFGLSPEWPLWDLNDGLPRRRQSGLRNRWTVRAANFMPGWMEIPTDPGHGREPVWRDAAVTAEWFEGPVYSLDVERWHHYVSGGAIVHNCVYLMPDLSLAGMREWAMTGAMGRDSIVRQMYVGMTRAREELVICANSSRASVDPRLMLGGAR